MPEYVDIPGSLLPRRRWKDQSPYITVTSPMVCPNCDREVSPQSIAYGRPGRELGAAADRGDVFLGGCVVARDFPSHRCPECGWGLGRIG